MLVYSAPKDEFLDDVRKNRIDDKILAAFAARLGSRVADSEVRSWRNSMQYMGNLLDDPKIPGDAGVAIEFKIPQTSKRIDFLLSGADSDQRETVVIIELKQWETAQATDKDAVVRTFLNRGIKEVPHPSYQAWTYAALLNDFNETIQRERIALRPCAYLHNCTSGAEICDDRYREHTERAPAFLKGDFDKLQRFIKQNIRVGDKGNILYRIDQGKIRPSKSLSDHLVGLLSGNQEFRMIDDQKIVYESALNLVKDHARTGRKQVMIVAGGPGTGKSVVAVNLLVELTRREKLAQYVSKNAAPRAVYASKLAGTLRKSRIDNLFKGSGAYTETTANTFDVLIVDEAHRLNEKSGMFRNLGENQVKELIHASRVTVFFVDENQRVTLSDIGDIAEIERWATKLGAQIHSFELASQFRCNGEDGYLAWLDGSLQIKETANPTLEGIDYEFRVVDSPSELKAIILEKNVVRNSARMLAGYCWDWKSKKDKAEFDIIFDEYGFKAKWNLDSDGSLWIVQPDSVSEVGCIHTCQGLELDYAGVIIGPDLVVRDGRVFCDPAARSSMDRSIYGYKKLGGKEPLGAHGVVDGIIRNTYRTLMTRGIRGCYIWCVDRETNEYFKTRIGPERLRLGRA